MKLITRGWEQSIDIYVDAAPLGFNDLFAYRRIKLDLLTNKNSRKAKGADTIVTQGICKRRELSKLQREDEVDGPHMLVEPAYLEEVQQYGYLTQHSPYFNNYDEGGSMAALYSLISDTPYDDVISGRFPNELLYVRDCSDSHMLFDENDQPYPCAMYFDYINGRVDNGQFFLKTALNILQRRDDVEHAHVMRIPYYNAETYCDEAVEFLWQPTAEDYRAVWEQCQKVDKRFPSTKMHHKALRSLDIFGLISGNANRYDDPYRSLHDEMRERGDDDDDY